MKPIIVAARRTPIGSFLGSFKDTPAVDLAVATTMAILPGLEAADVADVIVGNVLQAGQGMNPGRQIALNAGLPHQIPGQTINRVCGSGMQAIINAVQGILSGDGKLYLAGGMENMSRAPFLLPSMRAGQKWGNSAVVDSMAHDGLTDPGLKCHMGITAENVAEKWKISRQEQDAFALESHRRASNARKKGVFHQEIVPIEVPSRAGAVTMNADESIRLESSMEALAKLKPVFKQVGGTVTAGNASGLNDGAAMLAIADAEYAAEHGLRPLAEIVSHAAVGVDPAYMGMGPAMAVEAALQRAGLDISDVDLFELNEAFAAQAIAVCRDLDLSADRVNIDGGAIALGHPIGASGARVVVSLIHALRARNLEWGVASLCIGGGMGIAMVIRHKN